MDRNDLTQIKHALWELYRAAAIDKKTGDISLPRLWNTYMSGSRIVTEHATRLDAQVLDDIRKNGT
jgi:hypothetical protein